MDDEKVHERVRARTFELADAKGSTRAKMCCRKGDPHFEFYDFNGDRKASLKISDGLPQVCLEDADRRIELAMDGAGPVLRFFDDDDNLRANLYLRTTGPIYGPGISLWDAEGEPKIQLTLWDHGPLMERAGLKNPGPTLLMLGSDGNSVVNLPEDS